MVDDGRFVITIDGQHNLAFAGSFYDWDDAMAYAYEHLDSGVKWRVQRVIWRGLDDG